MDASVYDKMKYNAMMRNVGWYIEVADTHTAYSNAHCTTSFEMF